MVAAGRLGMDEEAEKHLRDILEIDPGHAVALNTIEEFLEQKGRWKDLADILRRKLDYARDPEARAALCIKIGASLGNMEGGVQGVIDAYNQALSHVPGDKRAFEALARVLDHERRWEELAQACLARAAVSTDQAEAQSLRLRAAAILRTEAADPRRAAGVYREALAADPGCMQALEALDGIYTGLESWKELLEVIEWRMAVEQDRAELQTLRSRAASMCAELLNDPVRAARHYEELRSLDPGRIGTLVSLEGIYDGLGAWEKLLETLRRHADLEDDPEEKAALLARMAELYSEKMGSADKAADLYRQVLQADPANITAVRRISAYCRERGDWAGALEMMGRETGLLGQSRDAVGVWFLMGKIHADTLLDPESARDCFARALGIDPSHVESLRALKAIHSSERNTSEYLKALLEEARHEPDPARKTELFFEAGGIYEDRLNDPTRAAACFEEALRLTPCHPPSARVLSDIYFRREDWARAGQCLEIVTAGRADGGQNLARQFYRLGFVNERMKEPVRALEAYRKAKELEPDYLPVLEGVTTALMNLERWEEAAGAYEEIVSRQGGTLSGSEIADLEFRIGGLYRRVGNNAAALEAYKRVLKADDRHTGALFALVEIHEALGENEDAYDLLVQLAFINEGREQFDLYMRTGLLCREKLDDQYRAIDAFSGAMAALEDGPAGLPAMDELYRLYRVTGQYQKSADLLVKIIEIEKEPSRLAAYHFELAELYKERLDGPDLAVEEYNKVLDIDPGQAKAFSAVETLLGSRKEWKRLEENYRAMIQRTPKEAKGKRLVLWRSLGELYRRVLKDTEAAIMAYEVVAGYEKDGLETLEILADLYSSRERHRAKAIKTHHTVVRLSNNPIRSVRALKKFYLASREYDKVFMACSVLKYLGQADGEDAKVLAALAPKARDTAQKPLTEELWEGSVIHPRAKGAPSAVMAYLRRHMGSSFVQSVETFGVRRKDVVDTDKSQIYFVNMFKYAVRATGVGDFTLYRAPAGMQGVRLVFSAPPAALAGEDMFKERPRKEIWFRLGRELALARPEFVIPSMLQPSELMALWSAVLSLVSPVHAQQAVTDPVIRWMETLKKNLTPDNLTALRALLAGRLSDGAQSGIEDWLEAVEYTCLRAGFALAGDLGICMAVAQESPGRLSRPAFRSVAREMVMYAVSEEYLALRVKLGLSVQA
jgi:tetratricopeptide (TPR) repeat protein